MKYAVLCLAVFIISSSGFAKEDETIGVVKSLSGEAFIVRDSNDIPAKIGTRLKQSDAVKTGKNSAIGIIFRDNGRLALGPNSRITIDQFIFRPANKETGFTADVKRGTVVYTSGDIAKINSKAVGFKTTTAICGIRGTTLAIKVEDN